VTSGVLLVHGLSGELFGNHVTHNSHHGGAAVVDLNIELAGLFFGVFDVGSEVTDSVVSVVLGGRHPRQLDKSEESKDLGESGGRDGTDTVSSRGDIGELEVGGRGKVSVEGDVVVVDDDTDNCSHGNTSVLALNSTTALEGLGLGLEPSKRIVDTEGLDGSKLKLTDLKGRGGLGGLGRGESGGRSGEEGGNSELHFQSDLLIVINL
jgi:hypothetical protein